jgi:hypothetical protein
VTEIKRSVARCDGNIGNEARAGNIGRMVNINAVGSTVISTRTETSTVNVGSTRIVRGKGIRTSTKMVTNTRRTNR